MQNVGKYAKKMAKIQKYLNYTEILRQVLRFPLVDAGAWLGGSTVEMMRLITGQYQTAQGRDQIHSHILQHCTTLF